MIDADAVLWFGYGFSFGLIVFTIGWAVLAVIQFAKSLLSSVGP